MSLIGIAGGEEGPGPHGAASILHPPFPVGVGAAAHLMELGRVSLLLGLGAASPVARPAADQIPLRTQ